MNLFDTYFTSVQVSDYCKKSLKPSRKYECIVIGSQFLLEAHLSKFWLADLVNEQEFMPLFSVQANAGVVF
jgi:hypothetical protein